MRIRAFEKVSFLETFVIYLPRRKQEKTVHVISRKPFNDAAQKYPNDRDALVQIYSTLSSGRFTNPDDLRQVFPSLDNFKYRDKWWVIDVGGNNLRIIAFIEFRDNRMYVKHVVSHADYSRTKE
jgi:mRNA interferase HigB